MRTEITDRELDYAPVVGRSVSFCVEPAGPYYIELRSFHFNAYLVLRDEKGALLAEDDNGLYWTHARIASERLEPGCYVVQACAQRGERGLFELTIRAGSPEVLLGPERMQADLDGAEERVLRLEALEGTEGPTVALALNDLGNHLQALGEYASAKTHFERALAIRRKLFTDDHRDIAITLSCLGQAHERLGEYAVARRRFEESIDTFERAGLSDSRDAMNVLYNLGGVLIHLGAYQDARRRFTRSHEISQRLLGPEHPSTLEIAAALAIVIWYEGHLAEARPILEQVLGVQERVAPDSLELGDTLQNLAVLVQTLGDYAAARPLFERSLVLYESLLGSDHPKTLACLNNLAILLRDQGDEDAAVPYLRRIVAACEEAGGPWNRDTLAFLCNLGTSLTRRGELIEARNLLTRALELTEEVVGSNHRDFAATLIDLSNVSWQEGDLETALQQLERARAIYEQLLAPDHPAMAEVNRSIAYVLWESGDAAAAEPLILEALEVKQATFGTEHPTTISTLGELALIRADLGRSDEAWQTICQAQVARQAHLRRVLMSLSESECFLYAAGVRRELIAVLALALRMEDPAAQTTAYEGLMAWKGQVTRLVAAGHGRLAASSTPEQRTLLDRLRACQSELSELALDTGSLDLDAQELRIAAAREKRNQLEIELQRTIQMSSAATSCSFADLRTSLPERTAALDFFVHPLYEPAQQELGTQTRPGRWSVPHYSVWITTRASQAPLHVDLGPAGAIDEAVKEFLSGIGGPKILTAARGVGVVTGKPSESPHARLIALLWDPIAPHLQDTRTIFVSPDGVLGSLPLSALQLEDGGFLIESFDFVYLDSPSSLVERPAEREQLDSLLSVGGVDFRERARGDQDAGASPAPREIAASSSSSSLARSWEELPATKAEAEAVFDLHAQVFGDDGDRLLLQGSEPREERLKVELPRYSLLHLATHGFFNPEQETSLWEAAQASEAQRGLPEARRLLGKHPGLLSGLVCAGANAREPEDLDDGYLTAEEVGWLDLSGVELVVLSACQTGLGRPQSGEGLLGLRRAFHTAGAKTVVSSLWSVQDDSTEQLMRSFSANLFQRDLGRQEALREAQLEMLRRNRLERGDPQPATWGAFVLSGEWR